MQIFGLSGGRVMDEVALDGNIMDELIVEGRIMDELAPKIDGVAIDDDITDEV